MCGRITATFEFSDIRVRWNLDRDLPLYTPRFNVAPETSPNIRVIVQLVQVRQFMSPDDSSGFTEKAMRNLFCRRARRDSV